MNNRKRFKNWEFPEIINGQPTIYGWTVINSKKFTLGRFTDIAFGCFINAKYGVEIEEDVQIGPFCAILSDNSINNTHGKIKIGKGSRIGAYTLILPNVEILPNSFIKARSIIK
jgi:acetyltransferase-like isoleucine patch superfamily enzyme